MWTRTVCSCLILSIRHFLPSRGSGARILGIADKHSITALHLRLSHGCTKFLYFWDCLALNSLYRQPWTSNCLPIPPECWNCSICHPRLVHLYLRIKPSALNTLTSTLPTHWTTLQTLLWFLHLVQTDLDFWSSWISLWSAGIINYDLSVYQHGAELYCFNATDIKHLLKYLYALW